MSRWRREAILLKLSAEMIRNKTSISISCFLKRLLDVQTSNNFIVYDDIQEIKEEVYASKGFNEDIEFLRLNGYLKYKKSNPHITKVTYWGKTSAALYKLPMIIENSLDSFIKDPEI